MLGKLKLGSKFTLLMLAMFVVGTGASWMVLSGRLWRNSRVIPSWPQSR